MDDDKAKSQDGESGREPSTARRILHALGLVVLLLMVIYLGCLLGGWLGFSGPKAESAYQVIV